MRGAAGDAELRRLERAWRASPQDEALAARYSRALVRAERLLEACALFRIRWEATLDRLLARRPLFWRDRELTTDELAAMIAPALARFAPDRLARAFPRRADGRYRLNTTRFLARYRAHEEQGRSRRLYLIAWTPGTASLWRRPDDRGRDVLTVGLETRSTRGPLLDPEDWGE